MGKDEFWHLVDEQLKRVGAPAATQAEREGYSRHSHPTNIAWWIRQDRRLAAEAGVA